MIVEKREANKTSTYKYLSSLPGEIPSLRKEQGNPTESGGLNELKSSEFGEAKAAEFCGAQHRGRRGCKERGLQTCVEVSTQDPS